jgi:hypothetical protein
MCPHETGAPFVLDRAPHGRTRRWDGVTLGRDEAEIIRFADPGDVSLHSLPEQDAKIGWLSSSAWIKCGTVEDDPFGTGVEYDSFPLAECLVGQLESSCPMRRRHNWSR